MKKTSFFSAAILLTALIGMMSFRSLPPRPSANGQGTVTLGTDTRHFSFSANTQEDGSVVGSGQLTYTGGGVHIEFDIDCMIRNGRVATMSGTVTAVSGNTVFEPGWSCWVKVMDNGEGNHATNPDLITLVYGAPSGLVCGVNASNAWLPVEGGNIQVKN